MAEAGERAALGSTLNAGSCGGGYVGLFDEDVVEEASRHRLRGRCQLRHGNHSPVDGGLNMRVAQRLVLTSYQRLG